MLSIKVLDLNGNTVAAANGQNEVNLFCKQEYNKGDRILIEASIQNIFIWLQLDDALGKSLIYLKGNIDYEIPFDEKRANLSPKAFSGNKHLITAKIAQDYEINHYRNLAINVNDYHKNNTFFPHASANVETRGESVFAAQNAIDGVTINNSHGNWPFESWGINMQDDACFKLDFGRKVEIDRIILYTRADFPHDNWWKEVSFRFSDNTTLNVKLQKSELPHEITFDKKVINWLELDNLIKSEDPSPFPALTQIEVYGVEINQ